MNESVGALSNEKGVSVVLDDNWGRMFQFISIQIYEELGGRLPYGNIELYGFWDTERENFLKNTFTGTVTIYSRDSVDHVISFFTTRKSYFKNKVSLGIVCIPEKKLFTEKLRLSYPSMMDAIGELWPDSNTLWLNCDPDEAVNQLTVFVNNETRTESLGKLLFSYREDIIWGFSWEGLVLRSVREDDDGSNRGLVDESTPFPLGNLMFITTGYNDGYDYNIYEEGHNSWSPAETKDEENERAGEENYEELESKNLKTIVKGTNYEIVEKNFYSKLKYYNYNTKFLGPMFKSSIIKGSIVPSYKLGDIINFKMVQNKEDQKDTRYFIRSNEFFYAAPDARLLDGTFSMTWRSIISNLKSTKEDINIPREPDDPAKTEDEE